MIKTIESRFRQVLPDVDFCSLRYVQECDEILTVRQDVPQPIATSADTGVMVTVVHNGGLGYAATSDLSLGGLKEAVRRATRWAAICEGAAVVDYSQVPLDHPTGEYTGCNRMPWSDVSAADKYDLLRHRCGQLSIDERIVDWSASLWHTATETLYLTNDGGRVHQVFYHLAPSLTATANQGTETQTRTHGGARGYCRQGGMEVLDNVGFHTAGPDVAREALDLLAAPNCPEGTMDLLLWPDQMILQIHESIGHPLELDRILGDERNYAGTSFVTLDMLGSYRYGSELLNVTFDPQRREQFASYAFDDEGTEARKEYIIKDGVLQRPLGGVTSQFRADVDGVACTRACSWNRPPIDRMANLNLEPGRSTFEEMLAGIERGVLMKTNRSWSIDDSRNKFQFGCEWGRMIEDGKLTGVVRNPNYRGISATFWRSLAAVGNADTFDVLGTPYCGKGEPNQCVRVGHAAPVCLFSDVQVFGGA